MQTSSDFPSHSAAQHFIPPSCYIPMTTGGETKTGKTSFFLVRAPEVDICPRQCPGWRQLWDTLLVWPPRPPWLPQSLQALPRSHSWFR